MWTLEQPAYLFLLIPVALLLWFRHFSGRRQAVLQVSFSLWSGSRFKGPLTWQGVLSAVSFGLFWLGIVLVVVALSGPSLVSRERIYTNQGTTIMVVLDHSPSMAAQDFGIQSRFDLARHTINDFLTGRSNDPIGLIAFANDAILRTPATLDYDAFRRTLESQSLSSAGQGTAIGQGLALAALHLKESGEGRKVIILLTDGENNTGEVSLDLALTMLVELGIPVYAVGIGGVGNVPLEYEDASTGKIFRGLYKSGFNEAALKDMAIKTGGAYFSAQRAGALEAVFQKIDKSEKSVVHLRIDVHTQSLVEIFLALGLTCLLFEIVCRRLVIKELI